MPYSDSCSGLDVEVGDVVASVDFVGCNKLRLFLFGEAHVVVLDGCESVQIYLAARSRNVKIISSKCMEVNVIAPAGLLDATLSGEAAEEYTEMPLPAQFVSQINENGRLVTAAHEHVGA